MLGPIWESLWNSRIGSWFSIGKRWILLIPIVWILLVLTVLVSAEFTLVRKAFGWPNAQAIITNPYFLIFSAAILLLCPIVYRIITRRPPPKDRIVVAVPAFYFPPGSERAKEEASNVHDRVRREIQNRMNGIGIKCSTPIPRETAQEPIDPIDDEGKERARLLGRHYRAHMVICGIVRLHGPDYYFHPYIENLATHRHRFSPSGTSEPLNDIPEPESYTYMKQKVDEVADLATFICALAQINRFEYEKAKEILDAIPKPRRSADVWFYRGLALLELGEKHDNGERFDQAQSCFEEACRLRPNFAFALMYTGIATRRLSKNERVGSAYLTSDELSGGYFSLASRIPPEELANDSTRRDRHLSQDISNRLLAFALVDASNLIELLEPVSESSTVWIKVSEIIRAIHDAERQALDQFQIGELNLREGSHDEALEALEKATELWNQATNLRAELESLNQATEADLDSVLRVGESEPIEGRAWASKALILVRLNRLDEAREAAQRASELDGDHYVLARAYAAMGERTNALANLSVAVKNDPSLKLHAEGEEEFDHYIGDEEFAKLIEQVPGELEEAWERQRIQWQRERDEFEQSNEAHKQFMKEYEEEKKRRAERQERRTSLLIKIEAQMNMAAKRRIRPNPGSFRFQLGEFDCISINDGTFNYPMEAIFANTSPQNIEDALRQRTLSTEQVPSLYTCLFINTGQHRVLIDTGAGALGFYAPELFPSVDHSTTVTGRLLENLEAEGIEPSQIDTVVITHAHLDQLGSTLHKNGELVFTNARYFMSNDELHSFSTETAAPGISEPTVGAMLAYTVSLHIKAFALENRLFLFDGEFEIVPGITAIPTPGHTPGHTALFITSDGQQLLHVSDAALHPLHLEYPQWTAVFDRFPKEAAASRRRILDLAVQENALVFAPHLPPFPNLGRVVKKAEGWEWGPVETRG